MIKVYSVREGKSRKATSFRSQRSLNWTESPAAVKMLTSPRTSPMLGLKSKADALVEALETTSRLELYCVVDFGEQKREGERGVLGGEKEGDWEGAMRDE